MRIIIKNHQLRKNRQVVLKLYFLLFAVFYGCAPALISTKTIAEYDTCSGNLTALLQDRVDFLKTLKDTAKVELEFKDGKKLSGRAIVLVKRPDMFRLEILGPFNQAVALIIYREKTLSLLSFQENRLYRNYPLPMDVSALPQYLLGLPAKEVKSQEPAPAGLPPNGSIGGFKQAPDRINQGQGSELKSHNKNSALCMYHSGDEKIIIDEEGNIKDIILSGEETGGQGIDKIQVSMSVYNEIDGLNVPQVISIGNKSFSISLKYDQIELNQDISEDLFNMPSMPEIEEPAPSVK